MTVTDGEVRTALETVGISGNEDAVTVVMELIATAKYSGYLEAVQDVDRTRQRFGVN